MFYLNGFYNQEINGSIPEGAVEITEEYYNELLNGQAAGLAIEPDEAGYPVLSAPTPTPHGVPVSVTPRQGVEMLIEADLYDSVVAYLDSIPGKEGEKARNRFARASEFRRDDPLVIAIATAQGMTSEQIDQMFIDAAQYE